MKNVVLKHSKKFKKVEEKVFTKEKSVTLENTTLKCMKNICSYYNKDIKLIEEFENFKKEN